MRFKLLLILLALNNAWAAITMPEAPPELSDDLKDFRTKAQIAQSHAEDSTGLVYAMDNDSIKIVSGDLDVGVKRSVVNYEPSTAITLPQFGKAIIRFYDLEDKPFAIRSFKFERQGFNAKQSASPYELIISQTTGASASLLQVYLNNYDRPLLFNVRSHKIVNEHNFVVLTTLSKVVVDHYQELTSYTKPKPKEFREANPKATPIDYTAVDQEQMVYELVDAIERKDAD